MGRQTPKYIRILAAAGAMLLLLLVAAPIPVMAADPPDPDNFQLVSVMVARHVVEDDDFVIAFHYNIHYDTGQPSTPANKLFHFRFMDTDGITQLGAIAPYPYNNSGYDEGASALYFSAADAPTWESAFVLRIEGNPQYWATPPATEHTLITSDYSQLSSQEENQTLLGNYLLDVARDLEINWGTTMVTETGAGTVLSSTGETYLRGTINGIQIMAPQIFAVQSSMPEYTEREWTEAQGTAYTNRYEGTWIGDALENLGDMLHVQWNVITGSLILGVIIGVFTISQVKFTTSTPGLIAGSLVFLMGAVMGWIAPAIMAITTLMFAIYIGYVLFFRHG